MRILITGANRGLGREIVSQLLRKPLDNLSLVVTARQTTDLQYVNASSAQSIEAVELNLDEKCPNKFQQGMQKLSNMGKFDCIFHTASPYFKTRLLESTPEQTTNIFNAQQNEFSLLTSLAKELTPNGSMIATGAIVSAVVGPTNLTHGNPWYLGMFSFYKASLRALMACLYQELPNNRIIHANLGTFCDEADTQNEYLKSGMALTTQTVASQLIDAAMRPNINVDGFNLDVMSASELEQLRSYCPESHKKKAASLANTRSNLFPPGVTAANPTEVYEQTANRHDIK